MMNQNFLPIKQGFDHQIIISRDGDNLVVSKWPNSLQFPGTQKSSVPFTVRIDHILQKPEASVLATALHIIQSGRNISQYLIPVEPEKGDPKYYLLNSELDLKSDQPVVTLAVEDVTNAVIERRRSAYIGTYHGIIGKSAPMLNVFHRISMYGPTDAPVIITGETGTGKELIARALHETSKRSAKPFVAVNCTALSPELFESELFGHEKGSFTGAYREHKGRFERAHEGTLFLDEIGDMPQMTQAKLLRTLEEGIIERVGSEKEQQVDVRIVAATNVGLEQAVQEQRFRSDLFHRLSVLRIHLPALRERRDDIPLLVNYFLQKFTDRYAKNIERVTPEALRHLQNYYWPGNIRELRNVMERLVVETSTDAIGARAVEAWEAEREYFMPGGWNVDLANTNQQRVFVSAPHQQSNQPYQAIPQTVIDSPSQSEEKQEITEDTIKKLFAETSGNLTEVARRLGVHKATLYRHMKQLELSREDLEAAANE